MHADVPIPDVQTMQHARCDLRDQLCVHCCARAAAAARLRDREPARPRGGKTTNELHLELRLDIGELFEFSSRFATVSLSATAVASLEVGKASSAAEPGLAEPTAVAHASMTGSLLISPQSRIAAGSRSPARCTDSAAAQL